MKSSPNSVSTLFFVFHHIYMYIHTHTHTDMNYDAFLALFFILYSINIVNLLDFIFNLFLIFSVKNVLRSKTFIQPLKFLDICFMASSSQVTLRADPRSGKSRLCNVLPAASLLCLLFLILTLSSEYKEEVCMYVYFILLFLSNYLQFP